MSPYTRSWTDAEDAIIREHYSQEGPDGTLQRLAAAGYTRSRAALQGRVAELRRRAIRESGRDTTQLLWRHRGAWNRAEEAILREHYPAVGPDACRELLVAAGYSRSALAVRMQANKLGLRAPRKPRVSTDHQYAELSACVNPKPLDPVLQLRLAALLWAVDWAMRRQPGTGPAEALERVCRAANRDPGLLDEVAEHVIRQRAACRGVQSSA